MLFRLYKRRRRIRIPTADYIKNKEKARDFINSRIFYFNEIYGFKFNRIAIRNQRRIWGSCSKKGNLNFNYRVIFLPSHLADYIIVHELCHLKELNHSRNFWELVERGMPEYKKIRKELKNYHFSNATILNSASKGHYIFNPS